MTRGTIRSIALFTLVSGVLIWLAVRAPVHIRNFYTWVDIVIMISAVVLAVLWAVERSER